MNEEDVKVGNLYSYQAKEREKYIFVTKIFTDTAVGIGEYLVVAFYTLDDPNFIHERTIDFVCRRFSKVY